MPLPTNPPNEPNDAPRDVLRYIRQLNKFLVDLLANLPKPTPTPAPTPAPEIRAGVGRIEKNARESRVALTSPIHGNYAVVVTEWRNEESNAITLFRLYVKQAAPDHFIIGHDPYTGTGDAPSYGWIAIKST
jgi:hypothetical protein